MVYVQVQVQVRSTLLLVLLAFDEMVKVWGPASQNKIIQANRPDFGYSKSGRGADWTGV